jgi:anti-sigma factor RsiW
MRLSNKDWVQLSAYLDGELNPRDAKRMEARIKDHPDLQFALDELREAKEILRQTPRLRPPREFRVTPEMIGRKVIRRPARGYQFAAAVMSFLLVGVLVLDFGRMFVSGAMAPAAPREVMLEAMPEAAADAVEETALMAEEEGLAEADQPPPDADMETPPDEEAPAVASEAVSEPAEEGEVVGATEDGEEKTIDTDTTANQTAESQEDRGEDQQVLPSQTPGPESTSLAVPAPTGEVEYFEETPPIRRTPRIDLIRVLEVVLVLGVFGFSLAAWRIRRRS